MNLGRTARAFGAVTVAVCALAGWAQPAQAADPQPTPGVFYEIFEAFSPFSPECVDVPSGNNRDGTGINVFHCHSGGNQLWQFVPSNFAVGKYQIVNHDNSKCLSERWGTNQQVVQESCGFFPDEDWSVEFVFFKTVPVYLIRNDSNPQVCLGVNRFDDGSPLLNVPCDASSANDLWSLG